MAENQSQKAKLFEATKKVIKSLAIPHKHGIVCWKLDADYREMEGRAIPYRELGYSTLLEFLDNIKDVVRVTHSRTNELTVWPVHDAATAHIQRMVSEQNDTGSSSKRRGQINRSNYHAKGMSSYRGNDFMHRQFHQPNSFSFNRNQTLHPFYRPQVIVPMQHSLVNNFAPLLIPGAPMMPQFHFNSYPCANFQVASANRPNQSQSQPPPKVPPGFRVLPDKNGQTAPEAVKILSDNVIPVRMVDPPKLMNNSERVQVPKRVETVADKSILEENVATWPKYEPAKANKSSNSNLNTTSESRSVTSSNVPAIPWPKVEIGKVYQPFNSNLKTVSESRTVTTTTSNIVLPGTAYETVEISADLLSDPENSESWAPFWRPVIITSAISPTSIWIQLKGENHNGALNTLMDQLTTYNFDNSKYNIPDDMFAVGMPCVARFAGDGCWHRARVTKILTDKIVSVYYVDYGGVSAVTKDCCKYLLRKFHKLPIQAVKVAMYGIVPYQNAKDWPIEARKRVLQFSKRNYWLACVFFLRTRKTPNDSAYDVVLCDTTDENYDIFIHEILIRESLASSKISYASNSSDSGIKSEVKKPENNSSGVPATNLNTPSQNNSQTNGYCPSVGSIELNLDTSSNLSISEIHQKISRDNNISQSNGNESNNKSHAMLENHKREAIQTNGSHEAQNKISIDFTWLDELKNMKISDGRSDAKRKFRATKIFTKVRINSVIVNIMNHKNRLYMADNDVVIFAPVAWTQLAAMGLTFDKISLSSIESEVLFNNVHLPQYINSATALYLIDEIIPLCDVFKDVENKKILTKVVNDFKEQ